MKTKCPHCGYIATEHETLNEETVPVNEDICFCIDCGDISEFNNGERTKVEFSSLDDDTKKELIKIKAAWVITKK